MALLLAATPVDAHCYSRWYYPWPQRCMSFGQKRENVRNFERRPSETGEQRKQGEQSADMPLPSLARADLAEPEADEATRALSAAAGRPGGSTMKPQLTSPHVSEWRDNLEGRNEMVLIEPRILATLIDEVLVARGDEASVDRAVGRGVRERLIRDGEDRRTVGAR